MKTLYLMRHAKATARESRQDDKTRELTQGGVKDSLVVGTSLRERNVAFDLIIASSAVRTEQTASLVAEAMNYDLNRILLADELYDASVRQFLEYVNNVEDAYNHVLIVGHNPAISYLAEYLTKADIGDMSTAGVAIIKFDFRSWKLVSENTGVLEDAF